MNPLENTVAAPQDLSASAALFDEVEALILDGEPGAGLRRLEQAVREPFPAPGQTLPDQPRPSDGRR